MLLYVINHGLLESEKLSSSRDTHTHDTHTHTHKNCFGPASECREHQTQIFQQQVLELLWTGFTSSSLDEIRNDSSSLSTLISKKLFNDSSVRFLEFIKLAIFRGPQLGRCFKGLHCPILAVSGLGRSYRANRTYGCSACLHPRLVIWYTLTECLKLNSNFASAVTSLALESLREEKRVETSSLMVVCDDVATRRMNMKRSRWLFRALAVSGIKVMLPCNGDSLLRSLYDSSNTFLKLTVCDAVRWLKIPISNSVRQDLVRLANVLYDKERSHRDVLSKYLVSLFQMLSSESEEKQKDETSRRKRESVYVAERFPTALLLEWIPDLDTKDEEDSTYVVEMRDEDKCDFKQIYRGSVPFCSVSSLRPEHRYAFRVRNERDKETWSETIFARTSSSIPLCFSSRRSGRGITLTNHNLAASFQNNETWSTVLGTKGFSTGRNHWTVHIQKSSTSYIFIGVANDRVNLNNFLGSDENGWGYIGDQALYHRRSKIKTYVRTFKFRNGQSRQTIKHKLQCIFSDTENDSCWAIQLM